MNENNLFDDNQNQNPFEQPQQPVEEVVVEQPVEEPVQQPIEPSTPAVDMGINVLNNVGAGTPDINKQIKKSVSKTPFIIIAVVLLLSLFVGGTGVVVKNVVFDKAPNKVDIPDDDASHMIKEDEEDEETEESEGEEESIEPGEETGEGEANPGQGSSGNTTGGGNSESSQTLEETVKKEENGYTKITIENFETDGTETARFYINNDKKLYEIKKISNDLVLYVKEAVDSDVEKGTSVEVYRRTFEPIEYEDEEGNTYLQSFMAYGSVVNGYVLIRADMESQGTYLIFDENLNVIQEGFYDYTTTPTVTDDAIYFPTIECGSSNHKYKINKLDLNSGNISVLKTNNYDNSIMYCQ